MSGGMEPDEVMCRLVSDASGDLSWLCGDLEIDFMLADPIPSP